MRRSPTQGLGVTVAVVLTAGETLDFEVAVGAGFVRSMVGVIVGGSRVGTGACVGVARSFPGGKFMNVGTGWVGVGASVGGTISVGVVCSSSAGRKTMLIVPAQYIASEPARTVRRHPYPNS